MPPPLGSAPAALSCCLNLCDGAVWLCLCFLDMLLPHGTLVAP